MIKFFRKIHMELLENRVRPYLAEWGLLKLQDRFVEDQNAVSGINEDKLIEHAKLSAFQQLLYESNVKVDLIESAFRRSLAQNKVLKELINDELGQNR